MISNVPLKSANNKSLNLVIQPKVGEARFSLFSYVDFCELVTGIDFNGIEPYAEEGKVMKYTVKITTN